MTTTQFPVNPTLTAVAIGYQNPDAALIAEAVLPRTPPGPKKFGYPVYNKLDAYTVPETRVGRKSRPTAIDVSGTIVYSECFDYALDGAVPMDEMEAWSAMNNPDGVIVSPLIVMTQRLTNKIQIAREQRVANLVFNTASYSGANVTTLSGTSQWSDQTNSNPLQAILTALDVPIMRPNKMVLGEATWTQLRQHPKVVQAVFGTAQTGGVVDQQRLADVLEIKEIVVGRGFINTANPGQTANYARAWGKHCALIYVAAALNGIDEPTFGFTAQFGTRVASVIPDPHIGMRGGEWVRVGESVSELISAPDVGYYFQNAVA